MNSQIHFLKTEKTALVVTAGSKTAETIWLALHGYGQHAEEFQKVFINLNSSQNYFVFPEALNRFYLKAGKGITGTSWMTKYYREKDIQDNNDYLNKVYENFISDIISQQKKFYVLGFSQGAATLIRWLVFSNICPDKIILWGAVFPPDMEQENYLRKLKQFEWYYFIGNEDEFISKEEQLKQKSFFETNQFKIHFIEYVGKHNIDAEILKQWLTNT